MATHLKNGFSAHSRSRGSMVKTREWPARAKREKQSRRICSLSKNRSQGE
jgi:hypothetical protein